MQASAIAEVSESFDATRSLAASPQDEPAQQLIFGAAVALPAVSQASHSQASHEQLSHETSPSRQQSQPASH
ncbi:hypothetical protein RISK_003940 [Rhodopirellula islandica]|uniref:Uncharacterized protein n=1 Tax=Rhodopirellula islandica TaxID=595434 RepID=A0A0J1BBS5_RHOIS|nr:hypothetical protein RISK_003940 [Rhodopirellula islandica]